MNEEVMALVGSQGHKKERKKERNKRKLWVFQE
jgi:hypothetical protein